MKTFLEQARAGTVGAADIDAFVERWHEGEGDVTLREFLGLTIDDYGRWLHEPGALHDIIGEGQERRTRHRAAS